MHCNIGDFDELIRPICRYSRNTDTYAFSDKVLALIEHYQIATHNIIQDALSFDPGASGYRATISHLQRAGLFAGLTDSREVSSNGDAECLFIDHPFVCLEDKCSVRFELAMELFWHDWLVHYDKWLKEDEWAKRKEEVRVMLRLLHS